MNRTEFIIATAIVLFLAFLLGWFVSWLVHRLTRASEADMGELDRMAQSLHDAEEMRDQAMAYVEVREAELTKQLHQSRGGTGRRDGRAARCAPRGRRAARLYRARPTRAG